jgi:hypothetical protein
MKAVAVEITAEAVELPLPAVEVRRFMQCRLDVLEAARHFVRCRRGVLAAIE